jgi:hypothetical protein
MEAWRQWPLGGRNLGQQKYKRIYLTPTGLLMEGDYAQNPRKGVGSFGLMGGVLSDMGMLRQHDALSGPKDVGIYLLLLRSGRLVRPPQGSPIQNWGRTTFSTFVTRG